MASGLPGNNNLPGQFGTWDAYPLWVAEAGRLADRRQLTNTLFLSINSLFIGAIAFLAQQSIQSAHLQISVSLLLVQIVLAVAGFLLSRQWRRLLKRYINILNFRYEKLREVEELPGFPGAIFPSSSGPMGMYGLEAKEGELREIFGFGKLEQFIPKLFGVLYVVSVILLILGVVAIRIHFAAWLGQYISIPVLK
jgi:hypothetical protein